MPSDAVDNLLPSLLAGLASPAELDAWFWCRAYALAPVAYVRGFVGALAVPKSGFPAASVVYGWSPPRVPGPPWLPPPNSFFVPSAAVFDRLTGPRHFSEKMVQYDTVIEAYADLFRAFAALPAAVRGELLTAAGSVQ